MLGHLLVVCCVVGLLATVRRLGAAEYVTGTIRICRAAALGDRHAGLHIQIPLGAVFADTGPSGDRGVGRYWPLWIVTTEAVTIDAGADCSMVQARIASDPEHHRVRVEDARLFMQAAAGEGGRGLKNWPGDLNLMAFAIADFK